MELPLKNKRIKLVILSIASLLMISMTASSILADIGLHFTNIDESVIQMVLSLPSLFGLIFAFAAGPLSMRISKKKLIIFSLISGLMGGLIALILGPLAIEFLLFSSALIGVAQGINATMTMALITDYFTGEESGAMMGLQSAFLNGGSMVLLLVSGLLANISWNYAYLVYLVFIPVLLTTLKYLPRNRPVPPMLDIQKYKRGKLNLSVYFISFVIFLFGLFFFVFQTNIALLVVEKEYGDATLSGLLNTSLSAAGMVTGIWYGKLKHRLKGLTIPIGIICVSIGMGLICFIGTLSGLFVASIFIGFGIGCVMPTGIFLAANSVNSEKQSTAIAIVTASVNLGMFASPIIINGVSYVLVAEGLNFKFFLSFISLFLLAALYLAGNRFILKRHDTKI